MPVSATSRISHGRPPASRLAEPRVRTATRPPAGVNFTAFLMRFQVTCCSLAGSKATWLSSAARSTSRASPFARRSAIADLQGVPNRDVCVDDLRAQVEPAVVDSGEVQEVVDQPGLELRIASDHRQGRPRCRRSRRVADQGLGAREHGRQRGPQLVAEDRPGTSAWPGRSPRPRRGPRVRPRHGIAR